MPTDGTADGRGAPVTRAEAARLWAEAGGERLTVAGPSMSPTLGEVSVVRLARPARLRFGEIVLYASGDLLVVHRIVGRASGPRLRTKGDGLPHLDLDRPEADRILASVTAIERGGRVHGLEGARPRAYAVLVATLSALEGFLYRFAWRADAALSRLTGKERLDPDATSVLRRAVGRTGRLLVGAADRLLFRVLNLAPPSAPPEAPSPR